VTALADAALDHLVEAILPRLVARGVVLNPLETKPTTAYAADYDVATCKQFLNPAHLGDSVLERMLRFFRELERHGEVSSPDLVELLGVKGPTSVPANLTNPMKKRARKLGIPVPWAEASTPDGARTIWRDRDGIASRMVKEIQAERIRRGLR
jgi:hypothetical protein